jgi:diguanylate cyclase (GGDEF)-like protein
MINSNMKNLNQQVLKKINNLLKKIGSEKSILTQEINEFYECSMESKEDQGIIDSLLSQIEDINEQMEKMNWLNKHYKILHDFAQICSKTLDEEILLNKAYEMVSQVMPTDSFYIAQYTEGDSQIHLALMVDRGKPFPIKVLDYGDNYTSKAIRSRDIIHHHDASLRDESDLIVGVVNPNSCIFVPIIIDDQVKGVISAQSYSEFAYRKEHEELLQIIGTQVINSIETARLYEKIYQMSRIDEMTELKNHRAFHEDLSLILSNEEHQITLVMIDSDNLKKVNDSYGHDMGDKYLKVLADGIKSICGENIEGYRYAGDEFMIIIKPPFNNDINELYGKLMEYYSHHSIQVLNNQITVSISSGVAKYPHHGSSVDSLKKSVDEALYEAKNQGGNRVVFAGGNTK